MWYFRLLSRLPVTERLLRRLLRAGEASGAELVLRARRGLQPLLALPPRQPVHLGRLLGRGRKDGGERVISPSFTHYQKVQN